MLDGYPNRKRRCRRCTYKLCFIYLIEQIDTVTTTVPVTSIQVIPNILIIITDLIIDWSDDCNCHCDRNNNAYRLKGLSPQSLNLSHRVGKPFVSALVYQVSSTRLFCLIWMGLCLFLPTPYLLLPISVHVVMCAIQFLRALHSQFRPEYATYLQTYQLDVLTP